MNARRGDVVVMDYFYAGGQASSIRPALVVQTDRNNHRMRNTIVVQITSKIRRLNEPTRVLVDPATAEGKSSGLHMPSVVTCENILTIHEDLIHQVIGRLSPALMLQVDACLKASLELP
jgi:mRNA-degrading endonuclease toxin of MazEF toxin-antitoxin module